MFIIVSKIGRSPAKSGDLEALLLSLQFEGLDSMSMFDIGP